MGISGFPPKKTLGLHTTHPCFHGYRPIPNPIVLITITTLYTTTTVALCVFICFVVFLPSFVTCFIVNIQLFSHLGYQSVLINSVCVCVFCDIRRQRS